MGTFSLSGHLDGFITNSHFTQTQMSQYISAISDMLQTLT